MRRARIKNWLGCRWGFHRWGWWTWDARTQVEPETESFPSQHRHCYDCPKRQPKGAGLISSEGRHIYESWRDR